MAPPNQVGEVVFGRGTISFDGYLKDDEATAAVIDAEWFHTGDLGYFDEDGYFFFVDRKKDIVRRGGENISSLEIEGVMRLHPHVADAAIVGKPDAVLGERVVAFVVPAEEHPEPDVASIQGLRRGASGQVQGARGDLPGRGASPDLHRQDHQGEASAPDPAARRRPELRWPTGRRATGGDEQIERGAGGEPSGRTERLGMERVGIERVQE